MLRRLALSVTATDRKSVEVETGGGRDRLKTHALSRRSDALAFYWRTPGRKGVGDLTTVSRRGGQLRGMSPAAVPPSPCYPLACRGR